MEKEDRSGDELIQKLKELDVCCVSDAMDRLGIPCGLEGIKAVVSGSVICGRAFTVHYIPCGTVKGTVGDFLDDVKPGEVVVIDNAGRANFTVWGDLMSISASKRGLGGTVIDGVCRDIPMIKKLNYNIFTKGHYMVTGKDRVEVDAVNVPVSISGVQVKPGDIILGDDTGVICIPSEKAERALAVALEIAEKEAKIEEGLASGLSLREARAAVNYHSLQTYEESKQ
ncbi:MAG TPA: RraA family protein [Anaerovoracaceae bacterium]|nr:RraA family protein [Anaerovoracaceae bacterium]